MKFYEWLRRSPEHMQVYLEIAEGWSELPTSDPHEKLDLQAIIQRARQSEDDNVVPLQQDAVVLPRSRSQFRVRGWAVIAMASLAIVVGLLSWALVIEADTYRTGVGEQRLVRLPDGSTLELNAKSVARVRFSAKTRDVDLKKGQALFRVAKDAARPFTVRSGTTTVRAVGTQFDVYRKQAGTVVTVLEGQVAVAEAAGSALPVFSERQPSAAAPPTLLAAGEQLTVPAGRSEAKAKPTRADVAAATAWVQQQLIFNETALSDVAEEFNRYSTRQLVLMDPELRTLGVSGVYSSTQPEALLGFLRAQPNIRLSETGDEIRVSLVKEK